MDATIVESIPIDYTIELWRSDIPISLLKKKYILNVPLTKEVYILKVSNVYIATGHFEKNTFVIDTILNKEESL